MATEYIYKFRLGGFWSGDIDFGQLIIDNPTVPLLGGKDPSSVDDFQAYVEGPVAQGGLETPIDTETNGIRNIVIDFEKKTDIKEFRQYYAPVNNTNNEMVKWDGSLQDLVSTGDTNTDTEVDFGDKTVIAGSGTFQLADIQSISSSGINIINRNIQTGEVRESVDNVIGDNVPLTDIYLHLVEDEVVQPNATVAIDNPEWAITVTKNTFVTDITLDFDAVQTNTRLSATRNGVEVWSNRLNVTTAGFIKYTLDVPLKIEDDGAAYNFILNSVDGDVTVNGEAGEPKWSWSYREFLRTAAQGLPDSSGATIGGDISVNDSSSITVSACVGFVIDDTCDPLPCAYFFQTEDQVVPVTLTSDQQYSVSVDKDSNIVLLDEPTGPSIQYRDYARLGFVEVSGGAVTDADNAKVVTHQQTAQFIDLLISLGVIRRSGLALTPNAGGNLSVDTSAGEVIWRGGGEKVGSRLANNLPVNARVSATMIPLIGSTGVTGTPTTSVTPDLWDNAGTLDTVSNNDWTVQHFYQAPVANGGLFVAYGQAVYNTLDDARLAADEESINLVALFRDQTLLLGRLIVRGAATDLTDPADAQFLPGAKFGSGLSGGAAGVGTGGGDVLGAASSNDGEIATASGTTGKIIKFDSGIRALNGELSSLSGDLRLRPNGTGCVTVVGDTERGELCLDTTNPNFSQIITFKDDSVDSAKLENEAITNIIRLTGPDNVGLHIDKSNGKIGLGGSSTQSGDYALTVDSVGALKPPFQNQAQIDALTVIDGSIVYNTDREELQLKNDGSFKDIITTATKTTANISGTYQLSFKKQTTILKLTMTDDTSFVFTDAKVGSGIVIELGGNFTPTFPSTFNELVDSLPYDGTQVNLVYIICMDDSSGSEVFDYRITRRL